jgi:SAM-dependent methyltransferase
MWIDSNVEIQFLREHLRDLSHHSVLDIGAGYGRLAAMMQPMVSRYCCVDAVPISTMISRFYLMRFSPKSEVLSLDEFGEKAENLGTTMAINIHSWSECSILQVRRWLAVIDYLQIPWLFTVSHGTLDGKGESAYVPRGGVGSFRPEIERYFSLQAEESIGLGYHPHALWRRKVTP